MTAIVLRLIVGTVIAAAAIAAQAVSPPDQFFDSNGVRIRYVEQGSGPPVVLLHGYTGTLDRHWIANGFFAALAKDHRVIAFDLRGHGKSGKPHDPAMYGEQHARDVVNLLDRLEIERAHIVGYSLGAIIAGRLATLAPGRLLSVACVGHYPWRSWTEKDAAEYEGFARELEGPTPFKSLAVGVQPPDARPLTDEEINTLTRPLMVANDVTALAAHMRGHHSLTVSDEELRRVRVPMMVIIGSDDPNAPGAAELTKAHPQIKATIVKGASHGGESGVLRRPETLAALRDLWSQ
jgi:pimeloyl-ACP methyl ester carboxylesterase